MANPWNQAPKAFNPVCYVPSFRKQNLSALPVKVIWVAAHQKTVGRTGKSGFTNHWCLYLQTGDKASVRIDCQPSYSVPGTVVQGGSKANIISELDYEMSYDVTKSIKLDVRTGLNVGSVINLLLTHGHHKYEFTAHGVGCRKWVSDQVEFFYRQGVAGSKAQCGTAKDV